LKKRNYEVYRQNPLSSDRRVKQKTASELEALKDDLYMAIAKEDITKVSHLIDRFSQYNYDLNQVYYREHRSALHLAALKNNATLVHLLLDAGINPFKVDYIDSPAPFLAAALDHDQALHAFLSNERGVPYHLLGAKNRTLLHVATYQSAKKVASYLMTTYGKDRAFLSAQDDYLESALHKAVQAGDQEIVSALKQQGINTELKDRDGLTAEKRIRFEFPRSSVPVRVQHHEEDRSEPTQIFSNNRRTPQEVRSGKNNAVIDKFFKDMEEEVAHTQSIAALQSENQSLTHKINLLVGKTVSLSQKYDALEDRLRKIEKNQQAVDTRYLGRSFSKGVASQSRNEPKGQRQEKLTTIYHRNN
jgi:Ankyrin repeats (3 copies)/Ankyrin repeat